MGERQFRLAAAAIAALLLGLAAVMGGDASYDLANYHLYDPWALLHGKLGRDFLPAARQTTLPPLGDLPFLLLLRNLPSGRLVSVAAAVPHAVAAVLVLRLTVRLLPTGLGFPPVALAALAVLFGVTGAATLPVLGTSMDEAIPCSLFLGGLLVLFGGEAAPAVRRLLGAGGLVGAAVAVKLTVAPFAAGLLVGLAAWSGVRWKARLRAMLVFGAVAAVALLLVDGWWWLELWRWSGNPVFPMANNRFRSSLARPDDFVDRRFLPHGWREAVLYPFRWAVAARTDIAEWPMRDPRIAVALVASVVLLLRREVAGRVRCLAAMLLVGFVLWERQFAILRYLSLAELLSGTVVLLAAGAVGGRGPRLAVAAVLVLALTCRLTVLPVWTRVAGAGPPVVTGVAPFDRDALVLLLDPAPLAFVAVFSPPGARWAGLNNNLTTPGDGTGLQGRIRAAVADQLRRHPDDLWGLDLGGAYGAAADASLAAMGLRRGACTAGRTNLRIIAVPIRRCRLLVQPP